MWTAFLFQFHFNVRTVLRFCFAKLQQPHQLLAAATDQLALTDCCRQKSPITRAKQTKFSSPNVPSRQQIIQKVAHLAVCRPMWQRCKQRASQGNDARWCRRVKCAHRPPTSTAAVSQSVAAGVSVRSAVSVQRLGGKAGGAAVSRRNAACSRCVDWWKRLTAAE